MITQQTGEELLRCCRLIEEKFGRGSGSSWSTQDFEQLSERIAEQTGVQLSVTTLKRIWNRIKYTSSPTYTTLNALATYIGYDSWQDFLYSPEQPAPADAAAIAAPRPAAAPTHQPDNLPKRRSHLWALGAGLLLIVVLAGAFMFFSEQPAPRRLSPDKFTFSSQPVTKGIPNSVIFQYDATAAGADSVFIQQSWDPRRRAPVPANGHEHSSIYYYPGYFRAKLIVDTMIVKEFDLIIPSDGWIAAVKQEPVPVYFKVPELISNGIMQLPPARIEQQHIALQPQPPIVYYANIRASTGLMSDNFVFRTRLRSDFAQGSAACQRAMITIVCKHDRFVLPLCAKGCVGDLGVYLGGKEALATDTDLSAFGCDMSQWIDVTCEVRNKHAVVLVNGRKAYETTFPNAPAEVLGVNYHFEGSGSLDYVQLSRLNGESVLEDDF